MAETQRLALQTATLQEQERIQNLNAETELLLALHRNRLAKQLDAGQYFDWRAFLVAVAVGFGLGIGLCLILQALTN